MAPASYSHAVLYNLFSFPWNWVSRKGRQVPELATPYGFAPSNLRALPLYVLLPISSCDHSSFVRFISSQTKCIDKIVLEHLVFKRKDSPSVLLFKLIFLRKRSKSPTFYLPNRVPPLIPTNSLPPMMCFMQSLSARTGSRYRST